MGAAMPLGAAPGGGYTTYTEREYVWGPDYVDECLWQVTRPGGVLHTLQDASKDVVALLDEAGAVARQYTYDPYGQVSADESFGSSAHNRLRHLSPGQFEEDRSWYAHRVHRRWASAEVDEMHSDDPRRVFLFHGTGSRFTNAVFSSVRLARQWISKHGLTGVLTAYDVDAPSYDRQSHEGTLPTFSQQLSTTEIVQQYVDSRAHQHFFLGVGEDDPGFDEAANEWERRADGSRGWADRLATCA